MSVNICQRETSEMVENIVSDVSVVRYVNISKEISDGWMKIQAKNLDGCEEERGECARISANMKVVSRCEYQPT